MVSKTKPRSLRIDNNLDAVIEDYLKVTGQSFSEFATNAIAEKIEDEIDLKAYYQALEENKGQPTYTIDEVEEMLGM